MQNSAGASGAWAAIKQYKGNFRVLGSTATVDARAHTGTNPDRYTGVPVYWIKGGGKVANNNADFYDGNWTNSAKGNYSDGYSHDFMRFNGTDYVYTGSYYYGTKTPTPLGNCCGTTTAFPGTGGFSRGF